MATTVCLRERTEVHQMQQFIILYQWMNKIQVQPRTKRQQHTKTKEKTITRNHDKMLMTKRRRNNEQIKYSTSIQRKNHNEMQSYTKLGKQRSTNGQNKNDKSTPKQKSKQYAKMKGNNIYKKLQQNVNNERGWNNK